MQSHNTSSTQDDRHTEDKQYTASTPAPPPPPPIHTLHVSGGVCSPCVCLTCAVKALLPQNTYC